MADEFKACSVVGCNGNAHYKANGKRGWCQAHHWRWRKHGDPLGGMCRAQNAGLCLVDGCDDPAFCKDLCVRHYKRLDRHGDAEAGGTDWGAPEEFYQSVVATYEGDECLIWPFARNSQGYGHIRLNGSMVLVTRRVCEADHGEPTDGQSFALHSCGNGHLGCVNRQHLRWGSQVENMADMVKHREAKG